MVFVECFGELGNEWGDFNSGEENSFLSLESNILGPSNKSSKISFRLNIISDSEVARSALEEGVRFLFYLLHCSFSFAAFSLS